MTSQKYLNNSLVLNDQIIWEHRLDIIIPNSITDHTAILKSLLIILLSRILINAWVINFNA